jgi:hypothetical protein
MSSPSSISTFNALHLGDNLVHLHFLRKLAQRYPEIHFTHGAPDEHLAQLYPLWHDLPNLTVQSIALTGQGAINAWCGAGGWWYQQPSTHNWCATYLRWLDHLAKEMGLDNPIRETHELLFDYPTLKAHGKCDPVWDFLIVNSQPMSGQWGGYSAEGFQNLAGWLHYQGKRVLTTSPTGLAEIACTKHGISGLFTNMESAPLDVTQIGFLSQICRCIIGCVTGPMWPCLNIWNADTVKLRIHLQDREHVNMAPNTTHANSLTLVPEILRDRGLL